MNTQKNTFRSKILRPLAISTLSAALCGAAQAQVGLLTTGGAFTNVTSPVTVVQSGTDNIAGLIQIAPAPVTNISQSGFYNRSAVVQFGATSTQATILQSGSYNRSYLLQVGPNNAANVNQSGPFNSSTLDQQATSTLSTGQLQGYVNNILFAPETVAAQGNLAQAAGRSFGDALLNRIDTCRYRDANAAYTADLPTRKSAPAPVNPACQWGFFAFGEYGHGRRNDQLGATGVTYDQGAITVGADYKINPFFNMGVAFNAMRTEGRLAHGQGDTNLTSYQIGTFSQFAWQGFFLDNALTYGTHGFAITRPGVVSQATATPRGNTFTVSGKAGYLASFSGVQLGPLVTGAYAHSSINPYTESGDPLITQSVRGQSLKSLEGGVGGRLRLPFMAGAMQVESYVDLTLNHEFKRIDRDIVTAFTFAPAQAFRTPVRAPLETYGKLSAGARIEVTSSAAISLNVHSTFARASGNDLGVNGGLQVRF